VRLRRNQAFCPALRCRLLAAIERELELARQVAAVVEAEAVIASLYLRSFRRAAQGAKLRRIQTEQTDRVWALGEGALEPGQAAAR
jgi:hypothetical protein